MTGLGWLLLAVAVLMVPAGGTAAARRVTASAEGADGGRAEGRADGGWAAGRGALAVAVAATAAASVAAFGAATGAVAAALVAPLAGALVRHAQRRPQRADPDPGLPLVLDLIAATLRSGRPVPAALTLAAPAGRADTAAELNRVAALCRLGADAGQAWAALSRDGPLGPLVPVAVRSSASGSKLAAAFERLAAELRAERIAAAAARAHRAGISALAPLAACFLPSFVCLGVVPVIVSVARTSLGVLR